MTTTPPVYGGRYELRNQIAATTGENVVIRRFSRFAIGE